MEKNKPLQIRYLEYLSLWEKTNKNKKQQTNKPPIFKIHIKLVENIYVLLHPLN